MPMIRLEPGAVSRVTLARPPLNILTTAMLVELDVVLEAASSDPATRLVLLTGEGRAFCAGVDVADHTADRTAGMIAAFHRVIERVLGLQCPVVAALNGAALGGGLELALACDIILARAGARFGQPEIRLGVFPPAAAALLPGLVGRQTALDLILTGRTVDAEEGRALGLLTHVFADACFADEVASYTAGMAALSGPVLRLAKRAVAGAIDRPLGPALREADRIYLDELMRLRDPHEGLAAFMEKREPAWRHR